MNMIRMLRLPIVIWVLGLLTVNAYAQPTTGQALLFAQITMDVMDSLEGEAFVNAIEIPKLEASAVGDAGDKKRGDAKPAKGERQGSQQGKYRRLDEQGANQEVRHHRERKKALDALDKAMKREGLPLDVNERRENKEQEDGRFERDRSGNKRDARDQEDRRGDSQDRHLDERFDRDDDRNRREYDISNDDRRDWDERSERRDKGDREDREER